jgi:hypothetical protein
MSFRQSIVLLKRLGKIPPIILHFGTVETRGALTDCVTWYPRWYHLRFEIWDLRLGITDELRIWSLARVRFLLNWCHFPILGLNCYYDRSTGLSYRVEWWGSDGAIGLFAFLCFNTKPRSH